MGETFAQSATSLGVLRSILDNYPFSVGLFREILQNSDDAGATTQTYVLDHRTHSTDSLSDGLAKAQGPAFLAHNDAQFTEANWHSIQAVYESSKSLDSSKIGKYGVGFRSVFHITDCPQIVSGDAFAMFDPLKSYTGSVGMKSSLSAVPAAQLAPFSYFMDSETASFDGTIIRCPLRSVAGGISRNVVTPASLAQLCQEFILKEAKIALLFLQNIKKIVVYEIYTEGVSACLLDLSISRSVPTPFGQHATSSKATVSVTGGESTTWRILLMKHKQDDAVKALSSKNSKTFLEEHKLLSHIGIAALADGKKTEGRLFTFLPLPLLTGFPLHIHAYFSLTQSRQYLRNSQETGLTEGTDDYLMIKWNNLLFERYIPDAWKVFLEVMAGDATTTCNIFDMWPPQQPALADNVYWKALPANLFNSITSSRSAVWPVYQAEPSAPTKYEPLDSLITAPLQGHFLRALTLAGLMFTFPPRHIIDIIERSRQFRTLSPKEAHDALLDCTVYLETANKGDLNCILEYLLSSADVGNVVDLPLFRGPKDSIVTLLHKEETDTVHTMLSSTESNIFDSCDDHAIGLHRLPRPVAEILRRDGPKKLNVAELTIDKTVVYLSVYYERSGVDLSSSQVAGHTVNWLSLFWIWVDTYPQKEELFTRIHSLYLLPSMAGLRKADTPLFVSTGEHPKLTKPLSALGTPFITNSMPDRAQRVLKSLDLLKPVSDIRAILTSLPDPSTLPSFPVIPADECTFLLTRMSHYLSGTLTKQPADRLRSLPIFPVIKQDTVAPLSSPKIACTWTSLPDVGTTIYSVQAPPFLPTIEGAAFVQLGKVAPDMARHIENASTLSDASLLDIVVDNFASQSPYTQAVALRHIAQRQRDIAPRILDKLRNTAFVIAKDGQNRKPGELLASDAPVARLYLDDPSRQVATSTDAEKQIARDLTALKLLQSQINLDIVHDVIDRVSREPQLPESLDLSQTLISMLGTPGLDLENLRVSPKTPWLPTNVGLRGFGECRDKSQPIYLFDKVLAVVEDSVTIPPALVKVFEWDCPLPVSILMRQLEAAIHAPISRFRIVSDVLKELGSRQLNDTDLDSLRTVTSNCNWVPTVDGNLTRTEDAVFLPPENGSGFLQICPMDDTTKDLLQRLGCSDCPSVDEIISKLEALCRQPLSEESATVAVTLLRSIRGDLSHDHRARLLVPNTLNQLSPLTHTFYNDIGDGSKFIPPDEVFVAHSLVDETLVARLGVRRLGLTYSEFEVPELDMGETPVVTVRNTLKQYTDKPFATEFFANASDAGATSFSLMCNRFVPQVSGDIYFSSDLAKFSASPSLVVHNNATFRKEDFYGICRTGVGAKQNERDKIGRFGLGALTMFAYTELAIIVSGDKVAFLNPSKSHLPVEDRAMVILPLNGFRKMYPGQLRAIDGLFGFDINSDRPYEGSIFYLPLREHSHWEGQTDPISTKQYGPESIEIMIKRFQETVPLCLFFTNMAQVQGLVRDPDGNQRVIWSYTTSRGPAEVEPTSGCSTTVVNIANSSNDTEDRWLIARKSIDDADVPDDCKMVTAKRHNAGLALPLGSESQTSPSKKKFNFLSTLPLPLSTTLPVHVMGSFVLGSDRREIRLDKYGGSETVYNRWLLGEVIPELYLFLLEHLLEEHEGNDRWWPELNSNSDEKSRIIVESFYRTHLRNSLRRVFHSTYDDARKLTPQEVVLAHEEPPDIQIALSALETPHIASLNAGPRHLAIEMSTLRAVNPAFVRDEIMKDPTTIHSLKISIVNSIIEYLSPIAEDPLYLIGLPILPLADSSFATFEERENAQSRFYVWRPMYRDSKSNFSLRHFAHPELRASGLLKMNMNLSTLDAEALKLLIAEECQKFSLLNVTSTATNWRYDFWESWPEYMKLGLKKEDICDFPLVPTIRHTTFVTLQQCKDGSGFVVLLDKSSESAESLRACLSQLGLQVVRPDAEPTPGHLIDILQSNDFRLLTFEGLLRALSELPESSSICQDIENLGDQYQNVLASWARESIIGASNLDETSLGIAQQLPIWPSSARTSPQMLRRATDLHMLPPGIALEIAGRFMSIIVGEYGSLSVLRGPSLRYHEIADYLEPPPILPSEDLIAYKSFLATWLPTLRPPHRAVIKVPNGLRRMVDLDTLYAREPLYQQAFGDDGEKFVHRSLMDLENILATHGLTTESDMNMSIFRDCAEAINNTHDDNLMTRAETLFDAYSFHLPARVQSDEREMWNELDGMAFVPRSLLTKRRRPGDGVDEHGDLDVPEHITSLPDVVSPLELVRGEFESVSWSQRAAFKKQPHDRVLNAHPSLGKPTISQVVLHLLYLSKPRDLTGPQWTTLIHDLKATCSYLNENLPSAQDLDSALAQISHEKVFLNIDVNDLDDSYDLNDMPWESADTLVFEIGDTEASYAKPVRKFLQPYARLLELSGVLRVYYPSYVGPALDHSEVRKLASLRAEYNRMRLEGKFTDVVFVTQPDSTSQSQTGRLVAHSTFLIASGGGKFKAKFEPESSKEGEEVGLVAHRSFLIAAGGGNFKDQFEPGMWKEGAKATPTDPVRIDMSSHSRECVELVLNFIYTGQHTANDAPIDNLLDILRFCAYWDIEDLFLEIQKIIIDRRLISLNTFEQIRETASSTAARALLTSCDDFERRNEELINRHRQATQDGSSA